MSILVVVAHPDDEVLGCGGTMATLAAAGVPVRTCILCAEADARQGRPEVEELHADLLKAQAILGAGEPILGSFPNIQFNAVPHLALVRFIEDAMRKAAGTVLFTHHPGDVNDDHRQVARAVEAAARLSQRGAEVPPLEALYFMEVASATDWSFRGGSPPFTPDTYFEIGKEGLRRKLEALAAYRGVMRAAPHPRSAEVLRAWAVARGAQAGMRSAEAFVTAFRRLSAGNL
jgi:LmbE family N-acetylglucosaminyl deacetylase